MTVVTKTGQLLTQQAAYRFLREKGYIGITPNLIREAAARGELPYYQPGRRRYFDARDLVLWAETFKRARR